MELIIEQINDFEYKIIDKYRSDKTFEAMGTDGLKYTMYYNDDCYYIKYDGNEYLVWHKDNFCMRKDFKNMSVAIGSIITMILDGDIK